MSGSEFWDTNLFIYLIEDSGERGRRVVELYERMRERGDALFTSALTLSEVLVKPIERRNEELRARYEEAIIAGASVLPYETSAARLFTRIRTDRSIQSPEAVQLACAACAGIDLFITNDDRLSREVVPGNQFIQRLRSLLQKCQLRGQGSLCTSIRPENAVLAPSGG